MPQMIGGATQVVVPLHFGKANVADADGTLTAVDGSSLEYVMPVAGSIIGITGRSNATFTTGTMTFQATIDGSLCPAFPDAACLRTNQQTGKYTQPQGKANYVFAAGARIGVMWDKAGTIDPTTNDVSVLLFVTQDSLRY